MVGHFPRPTTSHRKAIAPNPADDHLKPTRETLSQWCDQPPPASQPWYEDDRVAFTHPHDVNPLAPYSDLMLRSLQKLTFNDPFRTPRRRDPHRTSSDSGQTQVSILNEATGPRMSETQVACLWKTRVVIGRATALECAPPSPAPQLSLAKSRQFRYEDGVNRNCGIFATQSVSLDYPNLRISKFLNDKVDVFYVGDDL
jgi:hypothetical protein